MKRTLTGKYLLRKSKLPSGEAVVVVTGIFYPNFDIDTINSNDEMWVSKIDVVEGGLRFFNPISTDAGNIVDFLTNDSNMQSPDNWKNKEKL
jgi:hypothetical protein